MVVTLHDALSYRERGFSVVPAIPRTKQAGTADGKKIKWGRFRHERPTDGQLRRWFGDDDQGAIGVIAGDVSGGLVCRDFDDLSAYDSWAADHPGPASTCPTVATPRPGRHVYCLGDIGQIRSASRSGGAIVTMPDGEVRGDGLALLPQSIHPSGEYYRWLVPLDREIPKLDLREAGILPPHATQGHCLCCSTSVLQGTTKELAELVERKIRSAILRTLPEEPGNRHRKLFTFARELRAMPEVADLPLGELRPIVRSWHAAALPTISTKPFRETWKDFAEGLGKIRCPKGSEPIRAVFAAAVNADPPPEAEKYKPPAVRLLVAFCRELQRYAGSEPFYLACRTAGEQLGVDHVTASRWLKVLIRDEVLELVEKGTNAKHKASTYRYRGSRATP